MTKDIKIALSGHFQQFSLIWVQQCTQKLRICDIVKKNLQKTACNDDNIIKYESSEMFNYKLLRFD